MAVEAGRADAGRRRLAILGRIELLLRERRQQQAQPFELPRRENAVEQLEVIGERDQLALRDIAQLGARGKIEGWRKRRQEVLRQVESEVEAGQVTRVLPLHRIDLVLREYEAAGGMKRVRQGEEALRPEPSLADLVRAHRRELLPRHTLRQLHAHAFLQGLAALHRDALG